jgi:hypothetical protein
VTRVRSIHRRRRESAGRRGVTRALPKITIRTRSPSLPPSQFHFAPEIRSGRVPLSTVGAPAMVGCPGTRRGHRSLAEGKKTCGSE